MDQAIFVEAISFFLENEDDSDVELLLESSFSSSSSEKEDDYTVLEILTGNQGNGTRELRPCIENYAEKTVPRFSMLLLEPGEVYFEDFSCTISETQSFGRLDMRHGRLKLCSKSLVFEPKDWAYPLLKLHFKDCTDIKIVDFKNVDDSKTIIKVVVQQYVEMLEGNILAPYKFKYEKKEVYFRFDFATVEDCLFKMHQLQRASTLHAPEHNSMVATISHSLYMRMSFDRVMMDDFTEEIVLELPVEKISPLVRHQGKLALTPTTLYFQPFNNVDTSPILKLKLSSMRRMYKRRFLLRQVGLEIYSDEGTSVPHIYLSFQSPEDRDMLYVMLEQSPTVKLEKIHIEEMTMQWQNGVVSNYDYLMYLNCLADRSKNDLTQYPVFPWIISDYMCDVLNLDSALVYRDLSQPMGALNPDRLEKLKERYIEMGDPKFLYGSHYSAPGLVLFYLVRKYPQYMLCLQNGRFDHPDRMFNSVQNVFNNCLKNMSDFKELIPEFYDINTKGDFLVNQYEIDFGERHDGAKVQNVKLPPWASSPEDFVRKLRDALESDYVSRHLHLWIDLIFGYKQRGEEAVLADNVFYHVCYEGSVDLERIGDMNDRHALEVQIMEFGQIPKQLFTKPHVRKITHQITKTLTTRHKEITPYIIRSTDSIQLHREEVTDVILEGDKVISVGKDGTLKVYCRSQKKQIRSISLCGTPLSSCVMINENTVAIGSWDNEIYLYDVEYGRVIENFRAHDDSVSCLVWLQEERILLSGGWDCVVRAWRGAVPALRGLAAELDHDAKVTCLIARKRKFLDIDVISGTSDGEISVWNLSNKSLLNKISLHTSCVNALCLVTGERVVSAAQDGDVCITDLTVSHEVYRKRMPQPVKCLWWEADTLWLGGAAGCLLQWNMLTVTQTDKQSIHEGSINCIHLDEKRRLIITGGADRVVKEWQIVESS